MRSKENLELIRDFVNKKYKEANEYVAKALSSDVWKEERCSYGLARHFYHDMLNFINRECETANFFVERVCRTSWNLSDQYISSIIEVAEQVRSEG